MSSIQLDHDSAYPQVMFSLLVGRKQAALMLGIGTTTLDELIHVGKLKACRIGRRILIHRDDIIAFADHLRDEDGP